MLYMKFENGYENGRQMVEENDEDEICWSMDEYQENLERVLLTEHNFQGATAAEKAEHRAGYMRCVEDALVAGAVDASDCSHPDCPVDGCVL